MFLFGKVLFKVPSSPVTFISAYFTAIKVIESVKLKEPVRNRFSIPSQWNSLWIINGFIVTVITITVFVVTSTFIVVVVVVVIGDSVQFFLYFLDTFLFGLCLSALGPAEGSFQGGTQLVQ